MEKARLETFSDGVIAIIITIMVLQLKIPQNPTWQSYFQAYPIFASYVLSFVFVGLYWSAHHHLFHGVKKVNNRILWINLLNLFFLSFIPFTTASMGENSFSSIIVTVYAFMLIPITLSYVFLVSQLNRFHGFNSDFAKGYRVHLKSYLTIALNALTAIISHIGFPKTAFLILF